MERDKIIELYLQLVEKIKNMYEQDLEVKINNYDKDFLLQNDLPNFIDSIYTYLDENSDIKNND